MNTLLHQSDIQCSCFCEKREDGSGKGFAKHPKMKTRERLLLTKYYYKSIAFSKFILEYADNFKHTVNVNNF